MEGVCFSCCFDLAWLWCFLLFLLVVVVVVCLCFFGLILKDFWPITTPFRKKI